ncbi:MAG: UDP-N-acetylglucosamine 1-carboxyvinyltransferase [Candidatus Wallbacteria bacterium]|nr:UDP-N-acetylglucosamine 1-carboxyvinyltransferase [Candidatus Wallbacteria bacterium]
MDRFVIRGGNPLKGKIRVSGAKNAVLPLFAAALLADGPCRLTNVPRLRDVHTMIRVIETLGAKVEWIEPGEVQIDGSGVTNLEAPYDLVKTMRASFIVLGPLVARHGYARVALPGGCAIGVRQVDLHLKGLQAMGATIEMGEGYVAAHAKQLHGGLIYLDFPSVGATENLMLAASLTPGVTIIENAAMEPEIGDLARFLTSMGARVKGAGSKVIEVSGVERLAAANHRVIPDRIEAGTFMIAAAITGGHVTVEQAPCDMLESLTAKLLETGASIYLGEDSVEVTGPKTIRAVNLTTQPHPGFPTDLQAPFMAYLALARGTSLVTETIFENRFMHVAELRRMGADIQVQSARGALLNGVSHLSGAPVMASDLRAGAALVVAALAAQGETDISRIYHVDRGYEMLDAKLRGAGADIERIKEA